MKLGTFSLKDPVTPGTRICALHNGDTVVDLNYAYARYLTDVDNEDRAYELASARIPSDMLQFIQGGDRSIEAAHKAVDFISDLPAEDRRGVSGERLTHALSAV